MTSGANITRATSADLAALVPLFDAYRRFYGRESNLAGAESFLGERLARDESVVFLAREEGQALGFTQLFPSFTSAGMARTFILNDLFVVPEARGKGVGGALLDRAAQFAREASAVRLTLSTATDNDAAQSLYESQGWRRDEAFLVYHLSL